MQNAGYFQSPCNVAYLTGKYRINQLVSKGNSFSRAKMLSLYPGWDKVIGYSFFRDFKKGLLIARQIFIYIAVRSKRDWQCKKATHKRIIHKHEGR